jgi:hypothetical protein
MEENMATPNKSSGEETTKAGVERNEVTDGFLPLYTKSVDRFAELQTKALDAAAQQNAELIETYKGTFQRFVPGTPAMLLLDLAGHAFEKFVEFRKGAINLVVEQSHTVAGISKEQVDSTSKAVNGLAALVQQSVDYSIAAQKETLDFIAEQNKSAYQAAKRQFCISDTPATDSFQRVFHALVETQKAVLDIPSTLSKSAAV